MTQRADVIAQIPLLPGWFAGAGMVGRFFAAHVLTRPRTSALVGAPA